MRTLTLLASACTLLLATGASLAQETKPIPKHHDFMNICLEAFGPTDNKIKMMRDLAVCQCTFDRLPGEGAMTDAQFTTAAKTCVADYGKNQEDFIIKHASKAMRLAEEE